MARHQKELSKKQKTTIYISAAVAAIIAAVSAVFLVVHLVQNPPPVIFSSSKASYASNFSTLSTSSNETPQITPDTDKEPKEDLVISGITDGETYYTTQCAIIKGGNVDNITLNGVEVDNAFLIKGNSEDIHRIVITYLDGTTREITVYTMPINQMLEPLSGINEYSATADHTGTIKSIKASAQNAETSYSPYTETKALEDIITICDLMLNNIDTAAKELESIKNAVNDFESNELAIADSDKLTKILEDIDALTASRNLTAEQRSELGSIYSRCKQWLLSMS